MEDTQMAKKHVKLSLVSREMQVRTTKPIIYCEKVGNTQCWQECGAIERLVHCG